ncbi:hypothetical protein [Vibrio tapetis]|uniref:Uncharacterized protein n=1 Tax=Vibrio tapetis subsp. tapetis TaxID=1671868 RepID=A0A2N8ZMD9_9VIBR|nr:hypothetical protein [Vibrio tapetis]SON53085.1 protein of unknown function [Vibrio tapetis subsp. tapetis]
MQRVLLAVTGNHPQVVTETLFSMHQAKQPMPEKIIVMNTPDSRVNREHYLLIQQGLERFISEHQLDPIELSEQCTTGTKERSVKPCQRLTLIINPRKLTLNIADEEIKLTPKYFAFYSWLLKRESQGQSLLEIERGFEDNTHLARDYLDSAYDVVRDPRFYGTFGIEREDITDNSLGSLKGMDRKYVEQCRSNLKRKFREALSADLAKRLEVKSGKVDKVHACWLKLAANDIDVQWAA